jgi:hypothetical protein
VVKEEMGKREEPLAMSEMTKDLTKSHLLEQVIMI